MVEAVQFCKPRIEGTVHAKLRSGARFCAKRLEDLQLYRIDNFQEFLSYQ
jgi:hypothetical protein